MAEKPIILTPPGPFAKGILFGDVEQPTQGIYEESATQKYALGTKLEYSDGRIFRYAQNGAATGVKASMMQSIAVTSNIHTQAQATSYGNGTVGETEFVCDITTGSSLAENYLSEGYMVVNKTDGLGDIYKVLANKVDASDDTLMRVLLDSPIRTALVAASELTFVANARYKVVAVPTTQVGPAVGVMMIAATINYFCWLQTGGTAPLVVDTSETVVIGNKVGYPATPNVAGACGPHGAQEDGIWGVCRYVAAAAEIALVELGLEF